MNDSQIDAYRILGIGVNASEVEIRKAYHEKVKALENDEIVIQAYELIRDEPARKRYVWNSIHSYLEKTPPYEEGNFDFGAIASELAFLSDWECEEIGRDCV